MCVIKHDFSLVEPDDSYKKEFLKKETVCKQLSKLVKRKIYNKHMNCYLRTQFKLPSICNYDA